MHQIIHLCAVASILVILPCMPCEPLAHCEVAQLVRTLVRTSPPLFCDLIAILMVARSSHLRVAHCLNIVCPIPMRILTFSSDALLLTFIQLVSLIKRRKLSW